MEWKDLVQNAQQYGFLGPIVGIAGLFIGAAIAILFGWTRTFDTWKPPSDVLPEPLSKMVAALCAIAIFVAWIFAEPTNQFTYVRWVIWLAVIGVFAFLSYVGLRRYCGHFSKPLVSGNNRPGGDEAIWGGLWVTPKARATIRSGGTVEAYLAGNQYKKEEVWPPLSLTVSAIVTAFVLLVTLVCTTAAISTMATITQVVLTKKPAREVFGSAEVPGLPPSKTAPLQEKSAGKDGGAKPATNSGRKGSESKTKK